MKVLQFPSAYPSGQTPYDIFKDRMTAIGSIADGIKNIIANKFINNQLKMLADNILNEVDEQKANELVNLINEEPSDEIYPANLEDTVSQAVEYLKMGPMMKKEIMMGNLPNLNQGMPQATTGLPAMGGATPTPTTETMIPKTDIYQLYNAIKSMPSGQVNWANLLKTMMEKKPWFMGGTTGPEEYVLNQMTGQITDPREKMLANINLTKLYQETFYPEAETKEIFNPKQFLQEHPDMTITGYNSNTGGYSFGKKEEPESKLDVKDIFENIPEGFEISNIHMTGTEIDSYSLKPIDTTKDWEFDTYDKAEEFLRTHPQEGFIGKIETHGKGFDVTYYQKSGTTEKPPTIYEAKSIEETFMNNVENMSDMAYELDKLKSQGKETSFYETKEYYAKLMKKKYDGMLEYVNFALSKINAGEEIHEKTGKKFKDLYSEYYEKLKNYDQEYFNVTGQHLLEEESEIAKTGEANKILSLAQEMIDRGLSLGDLDLNKLKSDGIDIEELKKAYIKLYLNKR